MNSNERTMTFQEADRLHLALTELHHAGVLDDDEFVYLLKRLMVRDEEERWWAKSASTGEWHYYDGTNWIQEALPDGEAKREQEPELHETFEGQLAQVCSKYAGRGHYSGYYVGKAIPEQKLAAARTYFPIPEDETVYALIDSSDKMDRGLAVCEKGIRWNNTGRGYFLTLQALAPIQITGHQSGFEYGITLGKGKRFMGRTSAMPRDEVVRLLRELQSLARNRFAPK